MLSFQKTGEKKQTWVERLQQQTKEKKKSQKKDSARTQEKNKSTRTQEKKGSARTQEKKDPACTQENKENDRKKSAGSKKEKNGTKNSNEGKRNERGNTGNKGRISEDFDREMEISNKLKEGNTKHARVLLMQDQVRYFGCIIFWHLFVTHRGQKNVLELGERKEKGSGYPTSLSRYPPRQFPLLQYLISNYRPLRVVHNSRTFISFSLSKSCTSLLGSIR